METESGDVVVEQRGPASNDKGNFAKAISTGMVAIYKEHLGRGPTKVRTTIHENMVVTVLQEQPDPSRADARRAGRGQDRPRPSPQDAGRDGGRYDEADRNHPPQGGRMPPERPLPGPRLRRRGASSRTEIGASHAFPQ
jgi:hypothetical protein